MRKPPRRRRRDDGNEPYLGDPAGPRAEHSGREARLRHDEPRAVGWIGGERVADRGEREMAEGAASVPSLEPLGALDPLRSCRRVALFLEKPFQPCRAP